MTTPEPTVGSKADYFIIFGAAVRVDGTPSGTLRRRVQGAIALAQQSANAQFIVTGAAGRFGPPEAEVMNTLLLQAQIPQERVILEPQGNDTFSSVLHCKAILEARWHEVASITVCSSAYHNPRCALLLRLLNIHASWGNMLKDRTHLPWYKLFYFYLREPPAILWDSLLMVFKLLSGRVKRLQAQPQKLS